MRHWSPSPSGGGTFFNSRTISTALADVMLFHSHHAPKPDPLLEAMKEAKWSDRDIYNAEPSLRAALDALGFEIREKNDD